MQLIEVWGLENRISMTTKVTITLIIRHNDNHIGFFSPNR